MPCARSARFSCWSLFPSSPPRADAPQITTATRAPNGNTVVASYGTQRVFEVDRNGKVVWEHKDALYPFRARRR